MPDPRVVELLVCDDCPSEGQARRVLADALRRVDPAGTISCRERRIADQDQAETERFIGSPTFLLDGRDLFEPDDQPYGLTCRVYRSNGRPTPVPSLSDLTERLNSALGQGGVGGES